MGSDGAASVTNPWGETVVPNPVGTIVAVRAAQAGIPAAALLAALAPLLPPGAVLPVAGAGGAAVAAGLSAYFAVTFHPRSSFGCPLLIRLPAEAGADAIALTFDDGPHPETTPRLLDVLAEYGAKATFFLVGERAARFPHLARRIAEEGHAVGCHGMRHRAMVLLSGREINAELNAAREAIEAATGREMAGRLLRPPHGFKTRTLCRTASRLGWTLVAWTVDPRDYDAPGVDVLAARLIDRLRPGDIALLHERPGDETLYAALPPVLAHLCGRGLRCVAATPAAGSAGVSP